VTGPVSSSPAAPEASAALFTPDGERWVPTDYARGPWDPDALHGGPVAALVAREVERLLPDGPMQVVRLTLELLRPVPVAPLQVVASIVRPGRRVQLIDVAVSADGVDVAWCRALRVGRQPDPDGQLLSKARNEEAGALPAPPAVGRPMAPLPHTTRGFAIQGADLRFVTGAFELLGRSEVWIRLLVPVVPGEVPTPLQRAAGAADFINGVSAVLPFDRYVFINPDLTVHVEREPIGEWICLQAASELGTPGMGVAHATLFDESGSFGRAEQSLVVFAR